MRIQIVGRMLGVLIAVACAAGAAEAQQQKPATPGFDPAALDRGADPCVDFFQYACGGWLKANPIPADQSSWGRFHELLERNNGLLQQILEAAATPDPKRTPAEQKIGDYYAACMDETAIEAAGTGPLQAELEPIAALASWDALPELLARLHVRGVGALFAFSAEQDFKDATQVIAVADQGGLGLPDRDYYLKEDAASLELRQKYAEHVQRMLALLGDAPEPAAGGARAVLALETELAKVSLELVKRREPANIYHKTALAELGAATPFFAWPRYLAAVGAPPVPSLNVAVPEFFAGLQALAQRTSLADLKTYLRWHTVHAAAPVLPARFVAENFEFYGKALGGQQQMRPRWKRCVQYTDADLGEALGQRFVERSFGDEGRRRMAKQVLALQAALEKDIRELPWMGGATRERALSKLKQMATKIGAPESWRDYTALEVRRGDALGNSLRANGFEWRRQLAKIGRPVDRGEWQMSPPTVNAYYNPLLNDINFPVGILQPPFFDKAADDAVNFGAIGAVIGHELTHGFDDEGRQFAGSGNLEDWWTEADAKEFERRAACFVDQYAGYTAVADVKLNGRLTLGENVADNGGLRVAWMALQDSLAGKPAPPIDGFTPQQRFFLGFGQVWCERRRDEFSRMLAQVDPHSPGRYRVNGTVSNMPEFAAAFACKETAPMVRESACRVW